MPEPDAFPEISDEALREAIDHARTNAATKPTSAEYRQWWTARADALQRRLDERGKEVAPR